MTDGLWHAYCGTGHFSNGSLLFAQVSIFGPDGIEIVESLNANDYFEGFGYGDCIGDVVDNWRYSNIVFWKVYDNKYSLSYRHLVDNPHLIECDFHYNDNVYKVSRKDGNHIKDIFEQAFHKIKEEKEKRLSAMDELVKLSEELKLYPWQQEGDHA